jgi:hypothetical protein
VEPDLGWGWGEGGGPRVALKLQGMQVGAGATALRLGLQIHQVFLFHGAHLVTPVQCEICRLESLRKDGGSEC